MTSGRRLEQEKKASCKDLDRGHLVEGITSKTVPEVGINMAHMRDKKQASEAGMSEGGENSIR